MLQSFTCCADRGQYLVPCPRDQNVLPPPINRMHHLDKDISVISVVARLGNTLLYLCFFISVVARQGNTLLF